MRSYCGIVLIVLTIVPIGICESVSGIGTPAAAQEEVLLPDGNSFRFWSDRTVYRNVCHVAGQSPNASDANPGTHDKPFKTIGRAAEVLQPGEKVVVHEGVYRECVAPRRGGTGPDRMITYEAAGGETVVVSGAVPWQPRCEPSCLYRHPGLQRSSSRQHSYCCTTCLTSFGCPLPGLYFSPGHR